MGNIVLSVCFKLSVAASAVVLSGAALAADPVRMASNPTTADSWIVTVKVNAVTSPKWNGADANGFIVYPSLSVRKAGEPAKFSSPDDGIGFAILDSNGFSMGPVLRYRSGRYNGSNAELRGIHDVRWTVEPGVFANYWITPNLRVHGELRHGVRTADGLRASFGLDVVNTFGAWTLAIGPRLALANGHAMRTNYGVTVQDAAWNPNVYAYKAQGGLESYGVYGSATYQFNSAWAATLHGGYDRLAGDAGKTPIVRHIGSRDQFTVGLVLAYSFGMKPLW